LKISAKLVLARQRLRDRKHKTKRRKSKQARNKAEEKNQIQQMTGNFKMQEQLPACQIISPPLISKKDTTNAGLSCITSWKRKCAKSIWIEIAI
jgi:hypothetical protein